MSITLGTATDSVVEPGSRTTRSARRQGEERHHPAGRAVGPILVLCSSAALQLSAALSVTLFTGLGALGTSGLRFLAGAALLLALVRPRVRGRTVRAWTAIVAFGGVLAAMNVAFYLALGWVPLATVVTIELLGPLALAAALARRPRELLWVVLAVAGVVLLVNPRGSTHTLGLLLAALGAVGLACYVLLSGVVGRDTRQFDGLALSVTVAALVTLPLSLPAIHQVTPGAAGILLLAAGLGIVLAFSLEMQAIRRTSARTVSVLLSLDPAFAALAGFLVLGQALAWTGLLGMSLVVLAAMGVSLDAPIPHESGAAHDVWSDPAAR